MTTLGVLIVFAGYTVASYGIVLLRGYDIPLAQWVNPLDPWQWPSADIPTVPPGQVFP